MAFLEQTAGKDAVMFSRVVRLFLSRKAALASRKGRNMLSSQSTKLPTGMMEKMPVVGEHDEHCG